MFAVRYHYVGIARLLIKAGANLDVQNRYGATALHIATFNDQSEEVQLLLDGGIDRTITNKQDKTALDIARENNNQEIIKLFSQLVKSP